VAVTTVIPSSTSSDWIIWITAAYSYPFSLAHHGADRSACPYHITFARACRIRREAMQRQLLVIPMVASMNRT
jgi:hypothetical protein